MEIAFLRALAAAARAFADELERSLPPAAVSGNAPPMPGSPRSMLEVLHSLAAINDAQGRGASDDEMRQIARRAGIDPRGLAGYYAAHLLEKQPDGTRWLSALGRERLQALSRVVLLDSPTHRRPEPPTSATEDQP